MSKNIVCIVGNPNCGKTTLFNALTGSHQDVGNWPGVTVEKKVGHYQFDGQTFEIVDLPGIYSITPASMAGEDERVARDYILTGESGLVINIVDASNLERNLYLTTQLIEMRVPMLVVVNMLDIAESHKIKVDLKELEKTLGCPVVGIVAAREQGVKDLEKAIADNLVNPVVPPLRVDFDDRIVKDGEEISATLKAHGVEHAQWFAIQAMEGSPDIQSQLPQQCWTAVKQSLDKLNNEFEDDADISISDARYRFVSSVVNKSLTREGELSTTITDRIDAVILNRWLGIPIFLLIMYVMFLFTQNFGSAFIDFFDILFGGIFVDGFGRVLAYLGAPDWLRVILADGAGGGLQTVATFIPPIFFLFLLLAFLEDSGYMARAAFVMDRLMRAIGLPGRAFVPLIVGFGCNVPAIMATRTMDRATDRIITILMSPFMSCGARMPVYVLFATAFFPTNGQNLVFGIYIIGIVVAILTGFLMKRVVLPGDVGPFVMEIPPYHIPTIKGVLMRTWDRLKSFVQRAGQVIVVVVAVLSFLNSWGTDGSFGNEDTNNSVLSAIGKTIAPVLSPMGVTQENWPAAVGIFTGVLAKEAVVGSMNSLYDSMARTENAAAQQQADEAQEEQADEGWSLAAILSEASQSVVDNLADLGSAFLDPLGIAVDDLSDTAAAAQEQEVEVDTVTMMQRHFGSPLAAFAYLIMILLYMPCAAAISAVYRESGAAWTLFLAGWTTAMGYCGATLVYRLGTFAQNPTYAICAVVASVAVLGGMLVFMRNYVRTNQGKGRKIIPIVAQRRK